MNAKLQMELGRFFKKIKERKTFLEEELTKLEMDTEKIVDRLEEKANKKLSLVAKTYMDRIKFDFKKDRNFENHRIGFADGHLTMRKYKCHRHYELNLMSEWDTDIGMVVQFLPKGFRQVVNELRGFIRKIYDMDEKYKGRVGCAAKVVIVGDDGIKRGVVKEIILSGDSFEFDTLDTDDEQLSLYGSAEYQVYHNDAVFDICCRMLKDKKKRNDSMNRGIAKHERKIDEMLNGGYNKIMVAARLTE